MSVSYSWARSISSRRRRRVSEGPDGILEVHDRVDELAATALLPERGEVLPRDLDHQPVSVHRHVEHLRAVAADGLERAREGGRLRQDHVARIHEGAERERERVPGAVRDDDVLGADLEALEEPVLVAHQLAQAAVALGLAVGEGLRALGLDHPRRRVDEPVVREGRRVREAAAELVERVGDRARGGRGAPADAGAGGQELDEGVGGGGHRMALSASWGVASRS